MFGSCSVGAGSSYVSGGNSTNDTDGHLRINAILTQIIMYFTCAMCVCVTGVKIK